MIVGLNGFARSGKDAMAAVFVKEFGFKRVAFADILRNSIYRLNPIIDGDYTNNPVRAAEIVDDIGWEEAKVQYPEIRRLLQVFGTEVGRELLGENIWVDRAMSTIDLNEDIVITDMRYINEAQAIKDRNGVLINIRRTGVGPVNNHVSESGLPEEIFDIILDNNSTLEVWQQTARETIEEIAQIYLFKSSPPRYGDFVSSVPPEQ